MLIQDSTVVMQVASFGSQPSNVDSTMPASPPDILSSDMTHSSPAVIAHLAAVQHENAELRARVEALEVLLVRLQLTAESALQQVQDHVQKHSSKEVLLEQYLEALSATRS